MIRGDMNALDPITLTFGRHTLSGFSVSGLATYLQVPDLDVCFDMGECPLSALPLGHVFLTHAHGDHARCLLRHHALRAMIGIATPATYYLPATIVDAFCGVARAEARFEGVPEADFVWPPIVPLLGDRALRHVHHELFVSAFPVTHRVPSLGYTLLERRKKLRPEYAGLPGPAIGALKQQGIGVTEDKDVPLLTFIGDCIGDSLFEQAHIWDSPIVVIEATFLSPGDERKARDKGHTHLSEVVRLLRERGSHIASEHIVLKHFSLKHDRAEIVRLVHDAIPPEWRSRVALLV